MTNADLFHKMYEAVINNTAQVLTIEIAKGLKGRKITTIYFGYNGQNGVDEFVVGDIKRELYDNGEEGELCLFTAEGRNTYIRAYSFNRGAFACTDSDRFVSYVLSDED